MEVVKNIRDFKLFINENREKFYDNAVNASDISIHDEWMKENRWDEIYQQEEKQKNGKL